MTFQDIDKSDWDWLDYIIIYGLVTPAAWIYVKTRLVISKIERKYYDIIFTKQGAQDILDRAKRKEEWEDKINADQSK